MSRRRAAVLCLAAALLALTLLSHPGASDASQSDGQRASDAAVRRAGCPPTSREVRFDDGRLRVEREERALNPSNTAESWWTCWRPTGARHRLVLFPHADTLVGLSLTTVRHGRVVVLGGRGYFDVYDGRTGRHTASAPELGVVRELAITARGHLAVLQDTSGGGRELWAGDGRRRCFLDGGSATSIDGNLFGDLAVHGEHLEWHDRGVLLGQDLSHLSC